MPEDTRQRVLSRIRQNLRVKDPRGEATAGISPASEIERSARRRGQDEVSLLHSFEEELTSIGGNVGKVKSPDELFLRLAEFCENGKYVRVVVSREFFLEELNLEAGLKIRLGESTVSKVTDTGLVEQLRQADVGITTCEFLIAETGTALLRSSSLAPRALSLLPRAHIVVAREEQLVPTFSASLERLRVDGNRISASSCITLISGPSRTADIEKVLVKGVHGPKDFSVVILRGNS